MKEFDWKIPKSLPKKTNDKDEERLPHVFTGSIRIKMPDYLERAALLKQLSFENTSEGTVEVMGRADKAEKMAAKTIEIARNHVVSVQVTHSCGDVFTSLEDLEYFAPGMALISELSSILIGGLKLGEG